MITRIARKVNHKSAEHAVTENMRLRISHKKTITGGKYSRRFILLTKYAILANDEFDVGAELTF